MVTANFSSPWLWAFLEFESFVSFYAPASFQRPFWSKLLPAVMLADSESFIRGGKRKETCQEQSSDSSQISFKHHHVTCTETHLQNIPSARHPIQTVYFSHLPLKCFKRQKRRRIENRMCVSMTQRGSNTFILNMKKIFSRQLLSVWLAHFTDCKPLYVGSVWTFSLLTTIEVAYKAFREANKSTIILS